MILTELTIEGLKAFDRTLHLGPVTVLRGPMGSGKSEAINAIQLLVTGGIPARGAQKGLASADKIMALASRDTIFLRGAFDAPAAWVERTWTRKRMRTKGEEKVTVTEAVRASFAEGSKSHVEARVLERLGAWSEAWAPDDLIDLPRDQLRRRLVTIVATEDLSIGKFLPKDCPAWARPLTGQTVVDWVSAAAAKAKDTAKAAKEEVDALDAQLAAMPFVPEGEADAGGVTAKLEGLRQELVRASRRMTLAEDLAQAGRDMETMRLRVVPALSLTDAQANLNAAGLAAGAFKPIAARLEEVESRLTGMRAAIAEAGQVEVLDEDTAAARLEVARQKSAELAGLLTAAKASEKTTRADHDRRLAAVRHDLAKVKADLAKLADAENTPGVYDAAAHGGAVALAAKAEAALQAARDAAQRALGVVEDARAPTIPHCPKCGHDLAAHRQERIAEAQEKLIDADERQRLADRAYKGALHAAETHNALKLLTEDRERAAQLRERQKELTGAEREVLEEPMPDVARAEREASEAAAVVAGLVKAHLAAVARRQALDLDNERTKLLADLSGRDAADSALVDAAAAMDLARTQDALRRDIAKREVRVERLKAEVDDLATARERDAIEADIRAAESSLSEVGGAAERRTQRAQAEQDLEAKLSILAVAKHWVATFARLETEILGTVSERLTAPASKVLSSKVGVELTNARGGADCRITINGVDTATISKGERMTFLGGLLMSLAPGASGWRLLLMDELEAISLHRLGGGMGPRETFLRSMVSAVDEGLFDQVILGGCPDVLPEVPGVTVIDFGADAKRASGPAEAAA